MSHQIVFFQVFQVMRDQFTVQSKPLQLSVGLVQLEATFVTYSRYFAQKSVETYEELKLHANFPTLSIFSTKALQKEDKKFVKSIIHESCWINSRTEECSKFIGAEA